MFGAVAQVILRVEKHRQNAEVIVHSRHAKLSGSETTDDLYASISGVIEKLERQAKKHKEKSSWGKKKIKGVSTIRGAALPEERSAPSSNPEPRVIRTRSYAVKPMSIEDAILQVRNTQSSFIVFRDSGTQRISVVYMRRDGNYGLIEPEI